MLKPFRAKIKVYSGHTRKEYPTECCMQHATLEEILKTCKLAPKASLEEQLEDVSLTFDLFKHAMDFYIP